MDVIKMNGQRVKYDSGRIRATLERIKAKPKQIEQVIRKVEAKMYDGMTTGELFSLVRCELEERDVCLAHRYNLRTGLLKLGPAGFKFEKYIAAVLQAYGYSTELPENELPGLCVSHEVDVIAAKNGHRVMIEAKFRNRFEDTVTLKDTMATWTRFQDLVEGAKRGRGPRLDEVWIMTNGRFSDRAKQFGICKGIHLVGWSAEEQSLARMVDHAVIYPITVIDDLRQWELDKLNAKDIMLCRELAEMSPAELVGIIGEPADRAERIIGEAKEIVHL